MKQREIELDISKIITKDNRSLEFVLNEIQSRLQESLEELSLYKQQNLIVNESINEVESNLYRLLNLVDNIK